MTLESEYAHCIPMTIPPSAVSEPLTDFPLMIKIGRSAGKYRDDISDVFVNLGASYQKLAISLEDNTTQLPAEVTEWDVRRQLGILFAKVPTIPTTGMTLKLWYDSTHADNTTNVGAVGSAVGQSVWTTDPTNPITLAGSPQGAGRRWVQWRITRDAADTCAEDVLLLAVVIEYGTDGYSDA